MPGGAQTAVVVDRWPLVRLGIGGVLRAGGVEVVAEAAKSSEGLLLTRVQAPDLLVFGTPSDSLSPAVIRSAKHDVSPPLVVVLVASLTGPEISGLFGAGADALLVASVSAGDLADALERIRRGERVVGPELGPAVRVPRNLDPAPPPATGIDKDGRLTAKELEVLALLAVGHSNKQIARALFVTDATVKTHLQHIYGKLEVQNRHGALTRAAELGLLT